MCLLHMEILFVHIVMMYIDKMIEQVGNLIDMGYWIDPILILFFIYRGFCY